MQKEIIGGIYALNREFIHVINGMDVIIKTGAKVRIKSALANDDDFYVAEVCDPPHKKLTDILVNKEMLA